MWICIVKILYKIYYLYYSWFVRMKIWFQNFYTIAHTSKFRSHESYLLNSSGPPQTQSPERELKILPASLVYMLTSFLRPNLTSFFFIDFFDLFWFLSFVIFNNFFNLWLNFYNYLIFSNEKSINFYFFCKFKTLKKKKINLSMGL